MLRICVFAVATALLAGCGVADDRGAASTVVERFYDAVRAGDGAAACEGLSAAARDQLESQTEQDCEAVVTRLDLRGGAVVQAEVFVTNAKVDLRNDESAFLHREDIGWRITALGCKPAGDRQNSPYECEVEA